jgi:DNA-damage-inducible protein J
MEVTMSKTIQVRIDDKIKNDADALFSSLGIDTSTAIRIFINAALEARGIPFAVRHRIPRTELLEAIEDVREKRNLNDPFENVDNVVKSILED